MIGMEAIRVRDENQDDVYAVVDRSALLKDNRRLREALRDGREQVLSLATGMGQYMRPLANIPTRDVVAIFDAALAVEPSGILPSSYPAPPDKQPISTMVFGPGVENGSELARLKGRLDRAKPAEPSEEESDASR